MMKVFDWIFKQRVGYEILNVKPGILMNPAVL